MPATDRLRTALSSQYSIEREIGAGGMATVYLARDIKHDREVALKVLRADLSAVLGTERFLSEVRIAARLDHPHILTLIDSGEADGILYYVLPYVRGESLRSKLERERQLPVEEALSITNQVASALDYAHGKGTRSGSQTGSPTGPLDPSSEFPLIPRPAHSARVETRFTQACLRVST